MQRAGLNAHSYHSQSPMLQDSLTGKLAEAWKRALVMLLALVTKTSRTPPEWGGVYG